MAKIDLRKVHKDEYSASAGEANVVDVPEHRYIMVDGKGDPNTSNDFKACIEALYSASYKIKFKLKASDADRDYSVMPLEGLWWSEGKEGFDPSNKGEWLWTLMIMQPDFVEQGDFDDAVRGVLKKKPLPQLQRLIFGTCQDGLSAQILHKGPFSEEGPTIVRLHEFIASSGLRIRGKHREIYLSDMSRSLPENYKTIIRQPVERV